MYKLTIIFNKTLFLTINLFYFSKNVYLEFLLFLERFSLKIKFTQLTVNN